MIGNSEGFHATFIRTVFIQVLPPQTGWLAINKFGNNFSPHNAIFVAFRLSIHQSLVVINVSNLHNLGKVDKFP